MQVIIPLSGLGSRFVDAGYTNIKPLISINEKPIIAYIIDLFHKEDQFIFIINELYASTTNVMEVIKALVPNSILVTIPVHKLGPVHSIAQVYQHIDPTQPCIVSYCDFFMQWNYNDFKKFVSTTNCDGAMPSYTGFHPHLLHPQNVYASCSTDAQSNITEIKEKYSFTNDKTKSHHSVGVYYFKTGALLLQYNQLLLQSNSTIQDEYYSSLVLQLMIQHHLQVKVYDAIPYVCQWGTPFDLKEYMWWQQVFINIKKSINYASFLQPTTVVIPMAGSGKRFANNGYEIPKAFLPINQKPMFLQAISNIPLASNYVFITKQQIEQHILPNNSTVIQLQNTTNGQANSALFATYYMDQQLPLMIAPCDNGMQYDVNNFLALTQQADVIVFSFKNNFANIHNPNQYSWINVDQHNNVKNISCKQAISATPYNDQALTGAFWFKKAAFFTTHANEMISEKDTINNEYYIDNVINYCIKANLKVVSFVLDKYIGWGTPNDYETYLYWNNFFKNNII